MIAGVAAPLRLVELGSGDAVKTRYLIEAALARQPDLEYRPIDISESALEASSRRLLGVYPSLRVTPWVGDYGQGLAALAREPAPARGATARALPRLHPRQPPPAAGPGAAAPPSAPSSGPAAPSSSASTSRSPRRSCIPAYDDPLGVTAAFNLNHLARINRELGGEFDVRRFRHRARYDREHGRIEIHIVSLAESGRRHPRPRPRGRLRRRRDHPQRVLLQVRPGAGGRPRRRRRPHRRRLLDRPGRLLPVHPADGRAAVRRFDIGGAARARITSLGLPA